MQEKTHRVLALLAIFLLVLSLQTISAQENQVRIEGTDEVYQTVQDAIDNSSEGDSILVSSGEYRENLIVNVRGLKIKSVEEHGARIIGGEGSPTVIISAGEVELHGFLIKGKEIGLLSAVEVENIIINNNFFDGEGMVGREVWGIKFHLVGGEIKNNTMVNLTGTGFLIQEPRVVLKFIENEIHENFLGVDFILTDEETEVEFIYNVFEENYCHFSFNDPPLFDMDSFLRGNIFVDHYHLNFNEIEGKWKMVPCDHH